VHQYENVKQSILCTVIREMIKNYKEVDEMYNIRIVKHNMIRRDLFDAVDDLYDFCRQQHFRTYKVIDFIKNVIVDDDELLDFLNKCSGEPEDPRGNNIFYESKWPNLSVETDIKEETFKEFNQIISAIKKYDDFF